ncbi:MAG: hypothetical protein LBU32_15075 [Clostridiales bacterium]|jgi:hypothetical protein|nr:hypothetical protein [Clostridiales bacterium]
MRGNGRKLSGVYKDYVEGLLADPETRDLAEEHFELFGRYPVIYMEYLDGYGGSVSELIRQTIDDEKHGPSEERDKEYFSRFGEDSIPKFLIKRALRSRDLMYKALKALRAAEEGGAPAHLSAAALDATEHEFYLCISSLQGNGFAAGAELDHGARGGGELNGGGCRGQHSRPPR